MGNIVVSGRMRNPASPWAAYKDKLEVRSVAFAGPLLLLHRTAVAIRQRFHHGMVTVSD